MFEDAKSVLVVDDDASVRNGLKKVLEKAGYQIDMAATGKEALEKTEAKQFDAVLLDIKLPDLDGTELLLKLSKNKEMVKIVITGFSTVENGAKAADYGADDFLVKPVQPQELLCALKEKLENL